MLRHAVFVFLLMSFGVVGCASTTRSHSTRSSRNTPGEEKILNYDPHRTSSFAGRPKDAVRLNKFGGAKSTYTKSFRSEGYNQTRSFRGMKKMGDNGKTFAAKDATLSTKGRTVKNVNTPFDTRTASTQEFSGAEKSARHSEFSTHASTFRGQEQKQLDLEHVGKKDLTIDEIREIINRR